MFIINNLFLYKDIIADKNIKYKLDKNGFIIIKNVFSEKEINFLKYNSINNNFRLVKNYLINNSNLKKRIKENLNENYIFQDYIFIIKKSMIHTCHRDNNSIFYNKGQKHRSYTMLIYLEHMEKCLGVIPNSHIDSKSYNINLTDNVINLLCNVGDIILFDANLIHVGALNKKEDNLRIQMKITHKDDIKYIPYYNNYNKVLNQDNNLPNYLRKAQKKLSCTFPFISSYTIDGIKQNSESMKNGNDSTTMQKIYSYLFHGNSNFYDLQNAF
jgi:ectoine hydroxylase-related dioxygenase (phytanoyl-CoA dioxygenase family)